MKMKSPKVAIMMGSRSDADIMAPAAETLNEFEVSHEVRILSAHRTPAETAAYVEEAEARGIEVIIAGAGYAAHLAGAVAAHTTLPVIGVPLDSSPLKGIDALYATVQMPGGIPVATMTIGKAGAKNAALFAIQILSRKEPELVERLKKYRREMKEAILSIEL